MTSLCNEFEQNLMKGSQTVQSNLGNRVTKCKHSRIPHFQGGSTAEFFFLSLILHDVLITTKTKKKKKKEIIT